MNRKTLMASFDTSSLLVGALLLTTAAFGESPTGGFVVAPDTWPANHASTVVATEGGIKTCWFAGTREAGRDVRIVCADLRADGTWSQPVTAVKPGERAEGSLLANKFVGNPVLHLDHEGFLWLFYEAVQIGGHSGAMVDYKVSRDGGRTWSKSRRLAGGALDYGHLPRNKPLVLRDGRVMLPVYREFTSKYGYTLTLTLEDGRIVRSEKAVIPGTEHLQPTLVWDPAGGIRCYLRNAERGKVLTAHYDEATERWSEPVSTNLDNPNAAVDAINLEDGRILIAYNASSVARTPLSLAVSEDGISFVKIKDLETGEGRFGYPALIRTGDGEIHVTYTFNKRTIKYLTFSEDWVD